MKRSLYFICPTDYMEPIINGAFKKESYFYNSLGNSVSFNKQVLCETRKLIREKNINELSFVLSSDNRIVLDVLRNQHFSYITGLNNFYNQVVEQREQIEISWQTKSPRFLVFSYHLNKKIKELKNITSRIHLTNKL